MESEDLKKVILEAIKAHNAELENKIYNNKELVNSLKQAWPIAVQIILVALNELMYSGAPDVSSFSKMKIISTLKEKVKIFDSLKFNSEVNNNDLILDKDDREFIKTPLNSFNVKSFIYSFIDKIDLSNNEVLDIDDLKKILSDNSDYLNSTYGIRRI